MSLTCRELAELLMDYVDGTLTAEERQTLERHFGDCPPCVAYLRTYKITVALPRGLPAKPPRPEFVCRVVEAARRGGSGRA